MEFDPYSRAYFDDPYPVYRYLRDHAPVYRNDQRRFYALSRFKDVLSASLDPSTFSSAKGVLVEEMPAEMLDVFPMILMMDPPRQPRLRKLISKVFTPQRIAALEPDIRALAANLLDPLSVRGSCDYLVEYAAVLPMEVISTMLGVPQPDRVQLREWTDAALEREEGNPEMTPAGLDAMGKVVVYFADLVAERKRRPRSDMISHLIDAEVVLEDGSKERLTDNEVAGFASLISGAGNETVTKLLGNAVVLLHRHSDVRERLVREPSRIGDAIEEILRYWSPAHIEGRSTMRDVELHGTRIPAGSRVLLLPAAAARDEREFPDPDQLDISRQISVQIAFGFGIHRCLGAALARLEARVSLEELLKRIPEFTVDEDRTARVQMTNVVGYSNVPISYPSAT